MLLPEVLLDGMPDDSASGIRIFCKDNQKEVADFFAKTFKENWKHQEEVFEDEIGVEPDEIYADILSEPQFSEDSILFLIQPLDMLANDGARSFSEFGVDAFNDTVKALEEKYPGIEYEGCIQYAWCDEHCGDTISFEIPEDSDKIYDFVGERLNEAIETGELFNDLEWTYEPEEHREDILKAAKDYKEYLSDESYEKLVNFVLES